MTDYTANGVEIVVGLRVYTNNLDAATVLRLKPDGWHEVQVDTHHSTDHFNGERMTTRHPFTSKGVPACMECPVCREDFGSFTRVIEVALHMDACYDSLCR